MSGYQFARIQTYSLKGNTANRSAASVLAENSRIPGNANHVENPQPPRLLWGVDPIEVLPEIEKRVATAKAALRGTGQRIQSNTHVLEGAVYSHPLTTEDLIQDREAVATYFDWRKDVVDFAIKEAKQRGMEVLSVVEHLDESHPHIHVLAIPFLTETNKRLDAKACHPGHIATQQAAKAGENPRAQMAAYRKAMSSWQDSVWDAVSAKHALTRLGPRRKRYTPVEWTEQKRLHLVLGNTLRKLESAKAELGQIQDIKSLLDDNHRLSTENELLKSQINNLEQLYSDFKKQSMQTLNALQDNAAKQISELQAELARYKTNYIAPRM